MNLQPLDLFPTPVSILDFDDDPDLNGALLSLCGGREEYNDAAGRNMLLDGDDAIRRLKAKFDAGLTAHLERLRLAGEREVDAFLFANFTTASAFTPHHNHLIEADFVAIYYAKALAYPNEDVAGLYYAMDPGILVLHDPRGDAGLDGRTPGIADHHKVYPRANRMVIHPGYLSHSVTPSPGGERLALTCCFVLDKSGRYRDYVSYRR